MDQTLFNNEEFSDVLLRISDENNEVNFPAHSPILANRSHYFRAILRLYGGQQRLLEINISGIGTVESALEIIQKYIYFQNILTEDFIEDNINLLNFFLIDNKIYEPKETGENLKAYTFSLYERDINKIFDKQKIILISNKDHISFKFDWIGSCSYISIKIKYPGRNNGIMLDFFKTAIPDVNLNRIQIISNDHQLETSNKNHIKIIMKKLSPLIEEKNKAIVRIVFDKLNSFYEESENSS